MRPGVCLVAGRLGEFPLRGCKAVLAGVFYDESESQHNWQGHQKRTDQNPFPGMKHET